METFSVVEIGAKKTRRTIESGLKDFASGAAALEAHMARIKKEIAPGTKVRLALWSDEFNMAAMSATVTRKA